MTDQDGFAVTGVSGLDDVLAGGLARGHVFLLEGKPGAGKTTIALQFLVTGEEAGETCLYITLSETEHELRDGAQSHGWTIGSGVKIKELLPPENLLNEDQQQSLLYASDLELVETTKLIFAEVDRIKPTRVVIDSLSEIRLLAQSSLAIPAANIGDQAFLFQIRDHGSAARRPDVRSNGSYRAQYRAWRDYAWKKWLLCMVRKSGACAS